MKKLKQILIEFGSYMLACEAVHMQSSIYDDVDTTKTILDYKGK